MTPSIAREQDAPSRGRAVARVIAAYWRLVPDVELVGGIGSSGTSLPLFS